MKKKLLRSSIPLFFFSAFLLGFATQGVYGQSTLSPGDIAFAGFNGDGVDDFAIVALADIPANTDISFTDKELTVDGKIEGTGETFSWSSGSSAIPAGTVVTFNEISTGDRTVSAGSYSGGSAISLKVSGAVIFAFEGTEENPSFLASIATDSGMYDDLDNTDLAKGSTAILLSNSTDVAEYTGDRSGNTKNGYLTELNNISNWQEEAGANDQWELVLPFDNTSFTVVDPPTIAFTSATLSGEEGNTINLSVELIEADKVDVSLDVEFLSGASTADETDIDSYTTKTLDFTEASTGDFQDVSITLNGSDDFEGTEKAVFQLQNNTKGTIIEPSELTLSIEDDDVPNIVINEILADPGEADVDGNNNTGGSDDEFIEFVNQDNRNIDISGWKFSDDSTDIVKTFPEGTVIPSGRALVLFNDDSEGSPEENFGGALTQTSDQSLSLNNTGDIPTLFDANGNTVATYSYGSEAGDDQSLTIDPDNPDSYIKHSEATGANGNLFSPGTKVNGDPFGSKHAIGIRGSEGWRMISSPVQNASFNDFFGNLWMQGLDGSDDPSGGYTLSSWNEESGAFVPPGTSPGNMDDNLIPGHGYIVYVFEDDEYSTPGVQGGFPKIISSDGTENNDNVNVTVSATDEGNNGITGYEGFNLLGNPFSTDILVDEVIEAVQSAVEAENSNYFVNTHVYVWDDKISNYQTLSEGDGETIAPFQAFFVRIDTVEDGGSFSVDATFNRNNLAANKGTEFFKNRMETVRTFDLELHGEQYFDIYSVKISENGTTDLDRYDAYKLLSLNSNSINLFSTLSNNRLQKNVLPRELESTLKIPLSFNAPGRESLTFKWNELQDIPNDWDVMLVDHEMNREIDLRTNKEYSFNRNTEEDQSKDTFSASNKKGLLNPVLYQNKSKVDSDPRFVLSVQPKETGSNNDIPQSVKLNPNYPNPFNPQTTIPYELNEEAEVTLTIWNMIGQKVATLVDGLIEAGEHEESWNASNMPSGMYIARFEVAGEVFTRKMTLIK